MSTWANLEIWLLPVAVSFCPTEPATTFSISKAGTLIWAVVSSCSEEVGFFKYICVLTTVLRREAWRKRNSFHGGNRSWSNPAVRTQSGEKMLMWFSLWSAGWSGDRKEMHHLSARIFVQGTGGGECCERVLNCSLILKQPTCKLTTFWFSQTSSSGSLEVRNMWERNGGETAKFQNVCKWQLIPSGCSGDSNCGLLVCHRFPSVEL